LDILQSLVDDFHEWRLLPSFYVHGLVDFGVIISQYFNGVIATVPRWPNG